MLEDWQSKDLHILSLMGTGTTTVKKLVRDGFGVDKQRFSVHHLVVPGAVVPIPQMLAGEKIVIPWRKPELYMLSCIDWDRPAVMRAYLKFEKWVERFDNVITFDLHADPDTEIQRLADFLGLPAPESYALDRENEKDGSLYKHYKREIEAGTVADWIEEELAEHGLTSGMSAPR